MLEKCNCVRCGNTFEKGIGALSRWDNETEICSDCGVLEAFEHPTSSSRYESYCGVPYWNRGSEYTKMLELDWLKHHSSWSLDKEVK